jgi:hypothetical protein
MTPLRLHTRVRITEPGRAFTGAIGLVTRREVCGRGKVQRYWIEWDDHAVERGPEWLEIVEMPP